MAAGDSLKSKNRKRLGLGYKKPAKRTPAKKSTSLRDAQAKAKAATSSRQYGKDYAKARKIRATQARKKAGTSSNYDPLSSISVPAPKPKKKARNPKAAPKKERALKNSKSAKRRTRKSK